MDLKRITWITFNAFIDTDLYIVRELLEYYNIDWYILKSGNDRFEYVDEIEAIKNRPNINIHMLQCGKRLRSPECIGFYKRLLSDIKKKKSDLIYTSLAGAPYFIPVLAASMKRSKIVLAIHNVHVPKGGSAYRFFKFYNKLAVSRFDNYQTFSEDQYNVLKSEIPAKNIFWAPFILKDYGVAKHERSDKRITFLNFGNIRQYKRIDVLINAAQKVYEKTGSLFRVIIAGQCDNWEKYDALIKYPELFELHIERIDNAQVPELFEEADYFVAPYQDIAQSGSSVVAVNYGVPLIASRLPAFEEYIKDGETGRLIEAADAESLAGVMEEIIVSGNEGYEEMVSALVRMREEIFSTKAIVRKYRDFIDEAIKRAK